MVNNCGFVSECFKGEEKLKTYCCSYYILGLGRVGGVKETFRRDDE